MFYGERGGEGWRDAPRVRHERLTAVDSPDDRLAARPPRVAHGDRAGRGSRRPDPAADGRRTHGLRVHVHERGGGRVPRQPPARRGADRRVRAGHHRARQADLFRDRLRPGCDVTGGSGRGREAGDLPAREHPRRGGGRERSRPRGPARARRRPARPAPEAGDSRRPGLQRRRQRRLRSAGDQSLRAEWSRVGGPASRRAEPRPEPRLLQGGSAGNARVLGPRLRHLGPGADG